MRYKQRSIIFLELIYLCERLITDVTYLNEPLKEIISTIKSEELCKNLTFIKDINIKINEGEDFPVAWKQAIYLSSLPFEAEEKELLSCMGFSLGNSDMDSQIKILNYYKKRFIESSEIAEKKKEKYSSTIFAVWILFGSAVLLIIL